MQLRIDYIEAGETEAEEVAVLNVPPVNVDWNSVTPEQARKIKTESQRLQLPNGEEIEITAYHHIQPPSMTVTLKQGNKTLCSVFGEAISGLSTRTRQDATIGINIFTEEP